MKISYGKNVYGKEEIKSVTQQLNKSTQMGSSVRRFEEKVSSYFSKKYGLMVNSGSSAIMLAVKVLDLKKGDQVLTPCLNFGTAISSLMHYGVTPKFVDINIETLQIDMDQLEKKITKKTKAFLIPNLIGNIPDWRKIYKIAKKYNLKIIEDSADTLGAKIANKSTGIYSDISITSFYGSHVISCAGNGGMFLTNNKNYFERAKILRSWGRMSTLIKDSENISKRLTNKNVNTTIVTERFKVSGILSCKNTGARLGGDDTKPEYSTKPRTNAIEVTPKIPRIIAPGIFFTASTVMNKNPIAARKVSGNLRSPSAK